MPPRGVSTPSTAATRLLPLPLPGMRPGSGRRGDLTHQPALPEGLPSSSHWEGKDTHPAELAGTHQVYSHACLSLHSLVQASARGFSPHEETEAQRGEVSCTRPSAQPGAGRGDGSVQAVQSSTRSHPAPGPTPEPHGPPTGAPHPDQAGVLRGKGQVTESCQAHLQRNPTSHRPILQLQGAALEAVAPGAPRAVAMWV